MSSHHVVKEGQEPALFIVHPVSLSSAEPLLEWSPFIQVYAEAIDEVLRWGIKIDVVIGKSGQEGELEEKLRHQMPVRIICCPPEQDPLLTGMEILAGTRSLAANVMTTDPGYWFKLQEKLLYLNFTLITPDLRWSFVPRGAYNKWLAQGSTLCIHPPYDETVLRLSNLIDHGDLFKVGRGRRNFSPVAQAILGG